MAVVEVVISMLALYSDDHSAVLYSLEGENIGALQISGLFVFIFPNANARRKLEKLSMGF